MSFRAPTFVLVALALGLGVSACVAGAARSAPTSVVVERIIDGDTLVVRGGARIRLVQIDTPEARWRVLRGCGDARARPSCAARVPGRPRAGPRARRGRSLRPTPAVRSGRADERERRARPPRCGDAVVLRRRARQVRRRVSQRRRERSPCGPRDVGCVPRLLDAVRSRRDATALAAELPHTRDVSPANQTFGPGPLYLKRGHERARESTLYSTTRRRKGTGDCGPVRDHRRDRGRADSSLAFRRARPRRLRRRLGAPSRLARRDRPAQRVGAHAPRMPRRDGGTDSPLTTADVDSRGPGAAGAPAVDSHAAGSTAGAVITRKTRTTSAATTSARNALRRTLDTVPPPSGA